MNEHDHEREPTLRSQKGGEQQRGGGEPDVTTRPVDIERLHLTAAKAEEAIAAGIAEALGKGEEIADDTARLIAHTLSRAYGRSSFLAEFGRTGTGAYEQLRNEYLPLYSDPDAPADVKQWIDWLGTYLVHRENLSGPNPYQDRTHQAPTLDRLLVNTEVQVNGRLFTVHLPASLPRSEIDGISAELTTLQLDEDEALQAYLSLPDVDANTPDLMEHFHQDYVGTYQSVEHAARVLSPLTDWRQDLGTWEERHGFPPGSAQLDVPVDFLAEQLRMAYDVVEGKEGVYVFER